MLFSSLLLLASIGPSADAARKGIVRSAPPPPITSAQRGRWALVIGVDDYKDEGVLDLDFTDDDARTIASVLIESGTFAAQRVVLMTPDQEDPSLRPNRENILRRLTWLSSAQGAEQILLYFSGHGVVSGGENYIAPSDLVLSLPAETGISETFLLERLIAADVARRVVILDACRNRLGDTKSFAPAWSDPDYELSEGTIVLYSTEYGGYSYEDPEAGLGVFTAALSGGLRGAADGQISGETDGVIGAAELYAYVLERLQTRALETGQIQTPYRAGEFKGRDFALLHSPHTADWRPQDGDEVPLLPLPGEALPALPFRRVVDLDLAWSVFGLGAGLEAHPTARLGVGAHVDSYLLWTDGGIDASYRWDLLLMRGSRAERIHQLALGPFAALDYSRFCLDECDDGGLARLGGSLEYTLWWPRGLQHAGFTAQLDLGLVQFLPVLDDRGAGWGERFVDPRLRIGRAF